MSENTAEIDGCTYNFTWPAGESLLDAMLAAGIPAYYSCQQGECGACLVNVAGPETTMRKNKVLDRSDIAAGDRLACQTFREDDTPAEVTEGL